MNNDEIFENLIFYQRQNEKSPISDYYKNLDKKIRAKIVSYVLLLIKYEGKLGMPYARHIDGKIWELRVDFDKNYYRIFYFILIDNKIVFLHGFNKKSNKTPHKEIEKSKNNYDDFIKNFKYKPYEG